RAKFRRIDAVKPDLDAGDADAVAVDHLRGTDDVRDVPVADQAGGGQAGQSETGKQRRAGAAMQSSMAHRGSGFFRGACSPFVLYLRPTRRQIRQLLPRPKNRNGEPSTRPAPDAATRTLSPSVTSADIAGLREEMDR